ncbi:MAG: hypothetical protein N4J56_002727 [Chroococcidiopsis sp. SAG 2025]|nr:hypothetical protein [Chroococcidiopsis sp. SAG 2025]
MIEKIDLARSYCPVGQPPEYRRRSRVSHLSSGWIQSGSTTPCAPGNLSVTSDQ